MADATSAAGLPHYFFGTTKFYFGSVDGIVTRAFADPNRVLAILEMMKDGKRPIAKLNSQLFGFKREDLVVPDDYSIWQVSEEPYITAVQKPDGDLLPNGFGDEESALLAISELQPDQTTPGCR
jgi:hypothetical protein